MSIKYMVSSLVLIMLLLFVNKDVLGKEYSYEIEGEYIIHKFGFDKEETYDIAKGPYRANEYAEWMIERIEETAEQLGVGVEEITKRAVFGFKLTSMARFGIKEEELLNVEIRAKKSNQGPQIQGAQVKSGAISQNVWALEFYYKRDEEWKEL